MFNKYLVSFLNIKIKYEITIVKNKHKYELKTLNFNILTDDKNHIKNPDKRIPNGLENIYPKSWFFLNKLNVSGSAAKENKSIDKYHFNK